MPHDHDAASILDTLLNTVTALQRRHHEHDRVLLELIEMAAVDVQDVIEDLDDEAPHDATAGLNAISTWLAAYLDDQPDVTRTLIDLIDAAAATISNLDPSAYDDDRI